MTPVAAEAEVVAVAEVAEVAEAVPQSQLTALTTIFPQSPLCVASEPRYAVTPTVVCAPTGLYATSESPALVAATWVAPAAGVTTFRKSLFRVFTPAISGWPELCAPSVNALKLMFVE